MRTTQPKINGISRDDENTEVKLAVAGDRKAMQAILARHYKQMYHLALKVTRDPARAQDVTQEASIQVLRKLQQFRGDCALGSWLSRIVVNTALLRHRSERRHVPTAEIHPETAAIHGPDIEQLHGDREVLNLTAKFIGTLRDGDEELFKMRFGDDLSLEEISEATGLSVPALKSRFHRARTNLKLACMRGGWGMELAEAA